MVDNGATVIGYEVRIKKANMPYDEFETVHKGPIMNTNQRKHRIDNLDDGTMYFVQIAAINNIGTSDFSYAAAFTTTEAPIEVVGVPLRQHGDWREYWDDKRSRCIYYNVTTGTKQKSKPYPMRQGVDDKDAMFRKRRYRLLRGVHTDSAAILYDAVHGTNSNSPNGRQLPVGSRSPVSPLGSPSSGLPRPVIRVPRELIYNASLGCYRQMSKAALHMKWRVEFLNEDGIDSGGLTKEWFIELTKAMMLPERKLFIEREGDQAGTYGINPEILKSMSQAESVLHLRFCGVIFAKAIAERCMLGAKLDPVLAQSLVGADFVECSMEALETVDPMFAKSLSWILENDIGDSFGETLCACRPDNSVVDFCSGGRNVDVNDDNKDVYVEGMIKFKLLDELEPQREAFIEGFYSIVSSDRMNGFALTELNLMLTGKEDFDVDEFAKACKFEGNLESDAPLVTWFWEILEAMNMETRQSMLRFATGCPTVPLDGFDPEFTLVCNQELSLDALPRAHTCFNKLVLPPYSLHEQGKVRLEEKLLQALEYGTVGFALT